MISNATLTTRRGARLFLLVRRNQDSCESPRVIHWWLQALRNTTHPISNAIALRGSFQVGSNPRAEAKPATAPTMYRNCQAPKLNAPVLIIPMIVGRGGSKRLVRVQSAREPTN